MGRKADEPAGDIEVDCIGRDAFIAKRAIGRARDISA